MKKRIAILSSSRADYSIYYPLLVALKESSDFEPLVLAFGTHLSAAYGKTVARIYDDGFTVLKEIETLGPDDSPGGISRSMGKTMTEFAQVWEAENIDLIFCLGDRYEMFAAVASAVPFQVPIAHIHGGETTQGAIDEVFRHAITHMSTLHFATTEAYKERIISLTQDPTYVYNVGALSIDNLRGLQLLTISEFRDQFQINLSEPTILITIHPETVAFEKNEFYITEITGALAHLTAYQLVITMPNADTGGTVIRRGLEDFAREHKNAFLIESFGTLAYLSCMKHCTFMLGNTSSAFVEASFFGKPVINLGKRQNGRLRTPNMVDVEIDHAAILQKIEEIKDWDDQPSLSYGDGTAAKKILGHLRQMVNIKTSQISTDE